MPPPTLPVDGPEPEITLKPPAYSDVLPVNPEVENFIFNQDVSTSHTTRFSTSFDGNGYSMTARVDGDLVHFIATEEMGGETLTNGGKTWVRGEDGEWIVDDGWVANLDGFELPIFTFLVTPDVVYSHGYFALDAMEFDGWIETGEETLAVYRGGPEAVALAYGPDPVEESSDLDGGTIEAWWSPVGYFAMVKIIEDAGYGVFETMWTVTDVATTQVDPPNSSWG
jgi:hypothetical protein